MLTSHKFQLYFKANFRLKRFFRLHTYKSKFSEFASITSSKILLRSMSPLSWSRSWRVSPKPDNPPDIRSLWRWSKGLGESISGETDSTEKNHSHLTSLYFILSYFARFNGPPSHLQDSNTCNNARLVEPFHNLIFSKLCSKEIVH